MKLLKVRLILFWLLILATGFHGFWGAIAQFKEIDAEWQSYTPGSDPYSLWDRRFKRMIPHLPESGVIGYFSDKLIPGIKTHDSEQTVEYYLTRYALTPRVIHWSTTDQIAIANMGSLATREQIESALKSLDYRIVFELDQEIFLVQKGKSP